MRFRFCLLVLGGLVLLSACGDEDGAAPSVARPQTATPESTGSSAPVAAAPRRVDIEMFDIGYRPAAIEVKRGETVSFVFKNIGKIAHDIFLGDAAAQAGHEKDMEAMSKGGGHTGMEGNLTVDPGQTGSIRETFTEPGKLEIGCHQPGHYAGGMKIAISVV
jgi:uncharacterized cupredoxin-like copper-binding protein